MAQLTLYTGADAARYIFDYTVNTDSADSYKITGKMLFQAKGDGDFFKSVTGGGSLYFGTSTSNRVQTTSVSIPFTNLSTSWTTVGQTGEVSFTVSKAHATQTLAFWPGSVGMAFFNSNGTNSYISEPSSFSATMTIGARTSYQVTYNANGGSNAPSPQTKWHGESLTLSNATPTAPSNRSHFDGWATSSSGPTAYVAGDTYTGNSALSLYARWIEEPIVIYLGITSVKRCDNDEHHTENQLGRYIEVAFDFTDDMGSVESFLVKATSTSQGQMFSETVYIDDPRISWVGAAGSAEIMLGSGNARPDTSYSVMVIATPSGDGTTDSTTLPSVAAYYPPRLSSGVLSPNPTVELMKSAAGSSGAVDPLGGNLSIESDWEVYSPSANPPTTLITLNHGGVTDTYAGSSHVFGPYTYQQFDPHGGYVVGTVQCSDTFNTTSVDLVLPATSYTNPLISDVTAERADADGNLLDEGTNAKIEVQWRIAATFSQSSPSSLVITITRDSDGTVVATRTLTSLSGSSGTTVVDVTPQTGDVVVDNELLQLTQKYTVTATLSDKYTDIVTSAKSEMSVTVPIAFFTMDLLGDSFPGCRPGHGLAFGKPATREGLDVGMPACFDGIIKVAEAFSLPVYEFATEPTASDLPITPCFAITDDGQAFTCTESGGTVTITKIGGEVTGVKGDAESTYRTGNVNITCANIGAQPAGTYVTGVKGNSESSYRSGNVNLTAANIGAAASSHTHNFVETIGSYGGSTHAVALKSYFDANKSTAPRNKLVNMYSSAHGNGSQAMGYFLSGYDSSPYGGFFVANYNTPYYVGISNGTYTEWVLSKDGHTHNYMPKTTVLYYNATGTNSTVTLSASAANYNHIRFYIRDNNNHNVGDFTIAGRVNGYVINLNTSWADTGGQTTKIRRGTLSGTTFGVTEHHSAGIRGGPSMTANNNNEVYIYRVEGWNE